MLKISDLCKKHNLSRSTLLYYDSMGLLKPAERTGANYRLYSDRDSLRLERIINFRKAGLSLEEIKQLLEHEETGYYKILVDRFSQINDEIETLKAQQHHIASMLKNNDLLRTSKLINMSTWMTLMRSSGFDEDQSREWHMLLSGFRPQSILFSLKHWGYQRGKFMKLKLGPRDRLEMAGRKSFIGDVRNRKGQPLRQSFVWFEGIPARKALSVYNWTY